ncbi:DNA-binding response regulator [Reticulibacter mediterranei]|uniref:DNA-binding response regulator n=1 Tax=Reticulibacter mediterranei TaxID=2778369 RepID=A0A8J3IRP3_9CHLR|nr:response regulator transcription factor [Reticulibacter mediterranei]GHO96679.1 DNA-binding response regulator [Reticulibacter mediterranei]
MTIHVLLADDHGMVREGLRLFLGRDPELEIIAEATDGTEAVDAARQLHPDVILMDILMPIMDGISATATILQEMPAIKIIVLTNVLEHSSIVRSVKAGASGYLLKDIQADELCRAIKEVVSGQVQLSPQVSAHLMREVQLPETSISKNLTERESDVLRLLAQGHSNKDIARHLHVVEDTVKSHVRHILSKLGVQSRTQAALYAMRLGWETSDSGSQHI